MGVPKTGDSVYFVWVLTTYNNVGKANIKGFGALCPRKIFRTSFDVTLLDLATKGGTQ